MKKKIFILFTIILCSYTEKKTAKPAKGVKITNGSFKTFYLSKIDHKKKIDAIKSNALLIDNNDNQYRKVAKEISGYSSEGGILIFYYEKERVKKIVFGICNTMGKSTYKYYLNDDLVPIIIKSKKIKYDSPFYVEGFKIKSVELMTYYFIDGIPLYIVDNKHQNSAKAINQFLKYLEDRIYSLPKIMEMFNNPEAEILPENEIPPEILQND